MGTKASETMYPVGNGKENDMARQIIPRTTDGKFECIPEMDEIREIAERTASDLLKDFPNIDYSDLRSVFNSHFAHAFTMGILRETAVNID